VGNIRAKNRVKTLLRRDSKVEPTTSASDPQSSAREFTHAVILAQKIYGASKLAEKNPSRLVLKGTGFQPVRQASHNQRGI
jgi:hypothetical protein